MAKWARDLEIEGGNDISGCVELTPKGLTLWLGLWDAPIEFTPASTLAIEEMLAKARAEEKRQKEKNNVPR